MQHPGCPYKPFCSALLTDPLLLLDPERRPRHICQETLRASTEAWTLEAMPPVPTGSDFRVWQELESWLTAWPLPIGRQVMHPLVWSLAVTPGAEAAALALRCSVAGVAVDLFGLVRPQDTGLPGRWDWVVEPEVAWVIRGAGRPPPDAERLIRAARAWWARFAGQNLGRGRPVGTGTFADREAFLRALARAVRDLERAGRPVTQENVADCLVASSARTVRQWLKAFGLSWAEALELARKISPS